MKIMEEEIIHTIRTSYLSLYPKLIDNFLREGFGFIILFSNKLQIKEHELFSKQIHRA